MAASAAQQKAVDAEQKAHDDELAAKRAGKADGDPEPQLALPDFEGYKVAELRLNFSGNTLVTDKAVADALTLDGEVTLIVKGRVVSSNHGARRDAGGTKVSDARAVYIEGVTLGE